jgi:hypothetical protein
MLSKLILVLFWIFTVVLVTIADAKFLDFNNDVIAIQLIAQNLNRGDGLSTIAVRDLYQTPPFPVSSSSWPPLNIALVAIGQRFLGEPIYSAFVPHFVAILIFAIVAIVNNKVTQFAFACGLFIVIPDLRSELARAGSLASFAIIIIALLLTVWGSLWWEKKPIILGVLSGLLVLTRHEGIVVPSVLFAWYFYKFLKKQIAFKICIKYVISFLVVAGPMFVINQMSAGHFLISDNVSTASSVYTDHPVQFTYFSKEEIRDLSFGNNIETWVTQRYEWLKINTKYWFSVSMFPLILICIAVIKNIRKDTIFLSGFIVLGMLLVISLVPYAPITRYKVPLVAMTYFLAILITIDLNFDWSEKGLIKIVKPFLLGVIILMPMRFGDIKFKNLNSLENVTVFRERDRQLGGLLDKYMSENSKDNLVVMSNRAESISYIYKVKSIYTPRNFDKCDVQLKDFIMKWQINIIVEKSSKKWLMGCINGHLIHETSDAFAYEVK